MNLYILYEGVNAVANAKVHGGGTFSRWITRAIVDYVDENCLNSIGVHVLWPVGYDPQTAEEKRIYEDARITIDEVSSINGVDFAGDDRLLVPILESATSDFTQFRSEHQDVYMCTVIHGMRGRDLMKWDEYQVYYHKWYKPIPGMKLLSRVRAWRAGRREIAKVRTACEVFDSVYTVSNHSMQLICQYARPNRISYYHQATTIANRTNAEPILPTTDAPYTFLVNSGRPEKNALRALAAFCDYKKRNPDDNLHLYLLGSNDFIEQRVRTLGEVSSETLDRDVTFLGYVSDEELLGFYKSAYFLLYPSRSEGYGLPLLDAMEAGIPAVAGQSTSIPEVLGSAVYYVDPYNTESISRGIEFMSDAENNRTYRERVIESRSFAHERQRLDTRRLVEDILYGTKASF